MTKQQASDMSLAEAARRLTGDYGIATFWSGFDAQEALLEPAMLRAAGWCGISGYDPWWRSIANGLDSTVTLGISDPGSFGELFEYCRADLALNLAQDALEMRLWQLVRRAPAQDRPWTYHNRWSDSPEMLQDVACAAALVFCACRLQADWVKGDLLDGASRFLIQNQAPNGAWPHISGSTDYSISATADAIHAICLFQPKGWERAAKRAAEWLWTRQSPLGFWEADSCTTYATVEVLDAVDLAECRRDVTFRIPEPRSKMHPHLSETSRQDQQRALLTEKEKELWDALVGRALTAKELAGPDHLDTSADTIRQLVKSARKKEYAIAHQSSRGYYRPDAPPPESEM